MKQLAVKHFKKPFQHTIIYNFFSETEMIDVERELLSFIYNRDNCIVKDSHHNTLREDFHTDTFCLDHLYVDDRSQSPILKYTEKVFTLEKEGHLPKDKNPFLGYIPSSNYDNTFVSSYSNGSSYFEHGDLSILTFLIPLYTIGKKFEGGELIFTDYDFTPNMKHNSCLIFPGHEKHKLTPLVSDSSGYCRHSINRRINYKF
jgi:hypothetical protein